MTHMRSPFCGFRCEVQALPSTTRCGLVLKAHDIADSGSNRIQQAASQHGAMTVMHAMRPPRPRSAATSTAEVEGFLLSSLNLKIKAEPSFFCPLTGETSAAAMAQAACCLPYIVQLI